MTNRKFYKTTFIIEILSEEPLRGNESLEDLSWLISSEGGCSGELHSKPSKTLNGKEAAKELMKQSSEEPEFFGIDKDGNDIGTNPAN